MRSAKKKLPGTEISIPANPPLCAIEKQLKSMVTSGRFTLGEECTPYRITRYKIVNGELCPCDVMVNARKIPLKEVRQRLLQKHLKYMRLSPMSTINAMTTAELTERLNTMGYIECDTMTHEELCQLLVCCERTRSLALWHDHATILKTGFIMLTIHVMYDPITFYTNVEYQQK